MTIQHTKENDSLTVCLEGRLDTATAPQLDAFLTENLPGVKSLTIDLKALEYISSAGLRCLLTAQKTMNKQGKMVVKNPNDVVSEILDITGFTEILTIE